MYKLIFLILVSVSLVFGQVEYGQDVTTDNGNKFLASDTDSVYFSGDSLYIWGNDTAFIWINVGRTRGQIVYKGIVTSLATDSCIMQFDIGKFQGTDYGSLDTWNAESWQAMKTVTLDSSANGGFVFYPAQDTDLDDFHNNPTLYYILRIYGRAALMGRIWLVEEKIRAF